MRREGRRRGGRGERTKGGTKGRKRRIAKMRVR